MIKNCWLLVYFLIKLTFLFNAYHKPLTLFKMLMILTSFKHFNPSWYVSSNSSNYYSKTTASQSKCTSFPVAIIKKGKEEINGYKINTEVVHKKENSYFFTDTDEFSKCVAIYKLMPFNASRIYAQDIWVYINFDSGMMSKAWHRLLSFPPTWCNTYLSAINLSVNGFYYVSAPSNVQCIRCHQTISVSSGMNNPENWHAEYCPFRSTDLFNTYREIFLDNQDYIIYEWYVAHRQLHQQLAIEPDAVHNAQEQHPAQAHAQGSLPVTDSVMAISGLPSSECRYVAHRQLHQQLAIEPDAVHNAQEQHPAQAHAQGSLPVTDSVMAISGLPSSECRYVAHRQLHQQLAIEPDAVHNAQEQHLAQMHAQGSLPVTDSVMAISGLPSSECRYVAHRQLQQQLAIEPDAVHNAQEQHPAQMHAQGSLPVTDSVMPISGLPSSECRRKTKYKRRGHRGCKGKCTIL